MYGTMYGVKRTTVYFPDEMKTAIEREAERRGVTEAEVIRTAVRLALERPARRNHILPAIPEGVGESIAGRAEELLDRMGTDLEVDLDL